MAGIIWLPLPAICENWTSSFVFLSKLKADNDLQTDFEPAFHPIHLAIEFKKLIEQELVNNYADITKRYAMSRARVTQIMNLLALPNDVQSYLLGLDDRKSIRRLSERRLRKLIGAKSSKSQTKEFWRMAGRVPGTEGTSTQAAN